jgi:beta-N-acetylhexosaminidase
MIPAFLGLAGEKLTDDERALFREADPAGFILFARNCANRDQLRRLTDSLRDLSGRADLPILIDQEGGRVARMRPPEWPEFPAGWRFAELYDKAPISGIEAARANALALATMLVEAGINVDCLPLLDVRREGAHDIIGDRALGGEAMQVSALGKAMLDGLEEGGVCGVIKHMPGHGRAGADSHVELPVVKADAAELAEDLAPFRSCRDAPMGMTAHVLYPVWDEANPATLSGKIIADIIRGEIGFDNLLMSDDLHMEALAGSYAERARGALAAGCDIALFCSGVLAENAEVAGALGEVGEAARARLDRAMARIAGRKADKDFEYYAEKRDDLLAYV